MNSDRSGSPHSAGIRAMLNDDGMLRALLLAGVLLYGAWTAYVVSTDKPLDYYVYVIAARSLEEGRNVYTFTEADYRDAAARYGIVTDTPPYLYPAFTAVLVWPLSHLPLRLGAAVWILAGAGAALWAALLFCGMTNDGAARRRILAATIFFVPVLTTLFNGQVNLFILLSLAGFMHLARRNRRRASGYSLACGLCMKPFAVLLLPMFPAFGRWREAGYALLLCAVIILGGNSILLHGGGFGGFEQFGGITGTTAGAGTLELVRVQNLNALIGRLLPDTAANAAFPLYAVFASVLALITLLFVSREAWRWRVSSPGQHSESAPVQMLLRPAAVLIAATHLVAPLTWYHHLTMLLFPLAVLLIETKSFDARKPAWYILVLLFALTGLHGFAWRTLENLHPLLVNFPTFFALWLWGMLLVPAHPASGRTDGTGNPSPLDRPIQATP